MTGKRIVAVCLLCGHEYARLSDEAESAAHMAEAHGMYFDPRPLSQARTLPARNEHNSPGEH